MGMDSKRHALAALPREWPCNHCIGGWVCPKAGLDGCWESHPPPAFDPRTVQHKASCYTDYVYVLIYFFKLPSFFIASDSRAVVTLVLFLQIS
jgi:hypothetical protein